MRNFLAAAVCLLASSIALAGYYQVSTEFAPGAGTKFSAGLNPDGSYTPDMSCSISASVPLTVNQGNPGTSPWLVSDSSSQAILNDILGQLDQPISTRASESTLSSFSSTTHSDLQAINSTQTNGTQKTQVTNFPAIQPVSQSGTWTTGRTWTTSSATDSMACVQSGIWTTGRTWNLSSPGDSVAATQSGIWTTGRTWNLSSGSDSVSAVQSGTWTVQQGTPPWSVSQGSSPWIVSGQSAVGTTPTNNPVSVSGVDGGGLKRAFLMDTSGRIQVDLNDTSGVGITSQTNGSQRAIDVGVDVAGVQVDPRNSAVARTSLPAAASNGTYLGPSADPYGNRVDVTERSAYSRWGNTFSIQFPLTALTGTNEVPLIYINNPNGSGKSLRISQLSLGPTTGNNYVTYSIYMNPTVTANGTPMTINGGRQTGQNTSVALAFSVPTVSANGTLIRTYTNSGLSGRSLLVESFFTIWVEANNKLLITRDLSANATIGGVGVQWVEE